MMKNLNQHYLLDAQLFAEDDETLDDSQKDDTSKENEKPISMSKQQLESRLAREREKARKENESNIAQMIANALAEHDRQLKEQEEQRKSFESLTEEEKQKKLIEQREQEFARREQELNAKLRNIEISNAREVIVNQYDTDSLPRRDIFSKSIAPFIATLQSEEDKVQVYNAIKDIIDDVRKTSIKEAMKQNPPRSGDGDSSSYYSDRFVQKHKEEQDIRSNIVDPWSQYKQ